MAEYIEYHPLKFWLDPASIAEIVAHIQTYLVNNPINSTTEIETIIHDYLIAHPEIIGGVRSINGETGEVVLTADNISGGENVTIADVLDSLQDQIDDIVASIPSDYQQLIDDVSDLKSAIIYNEDKIEAIATFSKNLLDLNQQMSTGYLKSDGMLDSNANYSTTGYIALSTVETYTISLVDTTTGLNKDTASRMILLYDGSKNIISGSYTNDKLTHTVTGAAYVRVSFETYRLKYNVVPVIVKGTTLGTYQPYSAPTNNMIILPGYGAAMQTDLQKLSSDFSQTAEKHQNNNYLDIYATMTTGRIKSDGTISLSDLDGNYSTTGYIELDPTQTYVVAIINLDDNTNATSQRRCLLLYDSNKNIISNSYQNGMDVYTVTGANFIRVSFETIYISRTDKKPVIQKASTLQPYEPYLVYWKSKTLPNGDVLAGRKWWACGDSFTDWTTEEYTPSEVPNVSGVHHYKTYPYWIGKRTGMEVYNFAVSGQTMAKPAEGDFTNCFVLLYQQIPADVDYITIKLGINDNNHATGSGQDGEDYTGYIPIGDITDTTINSFCGAYNTVLEWLITNRPFAKIGIIATNGCSSDEYRQKTIAIAERWGLPWIDENGEARCPAMIRSSNPNVISAVKQIRLEQQAADLEQGNTHPNVAAHEYESKFIESFLRGL